MTLGYGLWNEIYIYPRFHICNEFLFYCFFSFFFFSFFPSFNFYILPWRYAVLQKLHTWRVHHLKFRQVFKFIFESLYSNLMWHNLTCDRTHKTIKYHGIVKEMALLSWKTHVLVIYSKLFTFYHCLFHDSYIVNFIVNIFFLHI